MTAIAEHSDDKATVLEQCNALQGGIESNVLAHLDGDWKVEWSDLGKGFVEKALFSVFTPSLKMLSFGALPNVKVAITGSYNRVTGGCYDLLQVFQVPDSDTQAAMVLRGACSPADSPARLNVQFESVSVLPPRDGGATADAALQSAGLGDALRRNVPIKAKPTYIDIEYLSGALRVHKGQSGKTYVLTRLPPGGHGIPFDLE